MVELLTVLPEDELLPHLRAQWEDQLGLRDTIALVLARKPREDDRRRLVQSLSSAQEQVVSSAAKALTALKPPGTPAELTAVLDTLRQYCGDKRHAGVRRALAGLLAHWTGQEIVVDEQMAKDLSIAYRPWFDWFAKTHPEASAALSAFGGDDAESWSNRLAGIDWQAGDAVRGKAAFQRRSCQACHEGGGKLGPDLAGAAQRFSREDLVASIVDPNKDVSPLYQTVQITTRSGQVHHGLIVYESPDGTLLQTGADTTIRVTGEELASMRPSRQSLMPTRLLAGVKDDELADLYKYLQSLGRK
jgi:putative heme-binding domain-containing protein